MYSIFSFPVNLVLFLVWGLLVVYMWRSRRKSGFVRFMLSPGATYFAIVVFLAVCLVIGLTGYRGITTSLPFVAFMLYFQTVLAYVVLRGWREATATGARLGAIRWRFLLLHVGLLTAIGSAFWGAPDTETYRMQAVRDVPVSEAYDESGKVRWLDCSIVLNDFSVSYGDDGMPSDYTAFLTVDDETVGLRVNHPYSLGFGKDLYLTSYDAAAGEYCILQVVREPWRYGALAGMVMMLAGALMLFIGGPRRNNNITD